MVRKTVSGMMLTLLLIGMQTLVLNIQIVGAEPKTWTVDDDEPADFSKIQDAIDAASPGDTIKVSSGVYCEHIVIPKNNLALIGENKTTTIIDGSDGGIVVLVYNADNLTMRGFKVRNGEMGVWFGAGHGLFNANTVTNNGIGIYVREAWYNHIRGNVFTNNSCGMMFDNIEVGWVVNVISNNVISNNYYGVYFNVLAWWNILYHNNIINNTHQALGFGGVWDNGYPSGGNYWGDYSGVDLYSGTYQNITGSDGIGDEPHDITKWTGANDNYPLMKPWTSENALKKLILDVENMNLQQGIDNSLDAKLTATSDALEALNADQRNDAISKLYAFMNEVDAQREKKLTNEQADYLMATAQEIIYLIE